MEGVVGKTRTENEKGNIWNKEKESGMGNEAVRDTNEGLMWWKMRVRFHGENSLG
jgi:hypothetical protein